MFTTNPKIYELLWEISFLIDSRDAFLCLSVQSKTMLTSINHFVHKSGHLFSHLICLTFVITGPFIFNYEVSCMVFGHCWRPTVIYRFFFKYTGHLVSCLNCLIVNQTITLFFLNKRYAQAQIYTHVMKYHKWHARCLGNIQK